MKFPAIAVFAVALSACTSTATVLPFAPGPDGFADKESEAQVGGIVGGGLIEGDIRTDVPRRTLRAAIEAEYRALEATPAGQQVAWVDERNGNRGNVTAAQPYQVGSQDCRSYSHSFEVNGTSQTVRGTACRNPNGSWTLLE
ncbi:RT0821/Lpp0805 family surface protein [Chelativorans sp. Marseille-P2723]|uniref:RT0821/Lpp0805 family surface protein n=1 Tax=Chelativorans sp. Marseille-P2723 TaxID=2709133 RepID=UPI00156DC2A9|nr:RT0821/Lpp0805 family surface protein [Chelativorans sp. Marseille-P2723]